MVSGKVRAVILANETEGDHLLWLKACESRQKAIESRVVNLTNDSWWEEIHKTGFDVLLAKPGGFNSALLQLFGERIYILDKVKGYFVYPSADEIMIYENKRFLSFWLKANGIPCPETHVFYDERKAREYVSAASYPLVAKVNIGASGSGVRILHYFQEASEYINRTFSGKGAPRRWGPNMEKDGFLKRGVHYLLHPGDIKNKTRIYQARRMDPQSGFVLFQEFIPHGFEWRVVRIGDSFFSHKKLKLKDKASGSLMKNYDDPPLKLLSFVKELTDRFHFRSQAVDLFESISGNYLINEMQCIFGQSDYYQMLVNGKPGRYLWKENNWMFEQGDFNGNESYDLRIDYIIESLAGGRS
jgi:hypothetical protein